VAGPPSAQKQSVPAPVQQQETGQTIRAPHVSSQLLENMSRVVT
jgi:hypothetical protein